MYVYIDESGDTGYTKKSTRYFILTAVVIDDFYALNRIVREIYGTKNPKHKIGMLHARDEDEKTKSKLARRLNTINIKSCVFVMDKYSVNVNDPYLFLLEKVVSHFKESNVKTVVLARKDTRKVYNQKITDLFNLCGIHLKFSRPTEEKSLQIADFYAWCIFVHLEQNKSEYFFQLQKHISFI